MTDLIDPAWELADKIAVIASVVAFLQFLALVATVWVMVRNGRRQIRAYVFVDHGSFELMTTDKNRLFIRGLVSIKNYGQTPGYEFVTSTRSQPSPHFSYEREGLSQGSVLGDVFAKPLNERPQADLRHVWDQFVEHAALPEQRMGPVFGRVDLEMAVHA